MVNALEDVARAIQDMAEGSTEPLYFLSALDPGVGKTRTLASALKVLVGDEVYADVGVVVFLSRRSEIEALVQEIGLARHTFAVMTSDQELNSIGSEDADSAQVLFTTQQRLEIGLEKMASFEAMRWFHYRGRPRSVRIWDESAIPGKVLTVDQYDLGYLFGSLGKSNPELATAIDKIKEDVVRLQSGEVYSVPDFAAVHLITDAGKLVDGFSLDKDGVEFFCHSPMVKHTPEGDLLRNNASLIFNVRFRVGTDHFDYLAVGDADWDVIEDIVNASKLHKNNDRLAWDIFDIPHHCSYKALNSEKGEVETTPTKLVAELLRAGKPGAYIVSPSHPIRDTPDGRKQQMPPHIQAKKCYERYLDEVGGG